MAVLSYRYTILKHYYKKSLLKNFEKIDFNEFIAVTDGKLCDGGFRYLHKNKNPSSNSEENESLAHWQCSQDPQVSISACISNFHHPTQILEEFIQCYGRKMLTVTDGKLSSQVEKGEDSIHKTFLRGQNFITSLKIENSHMEDSHKNVLYKVIHRLVV